MNCFRSLLTLLALCAFTSSCKSGGEKQTKKEPKKVAAGSGKVPAQNQSTTLPPTINVPAGTTALNVNGTNFQGLAAASLQNLGQTVTGTGGLVALKGLAGADSNNSYLLEFTLIDGGALTLITNAQNSLDSGVSITFKKKGTTLQVLANKQGASTDISSGFAALAAMNPIRVLFNINNSETLAHIVAFPADATSFTEETAIFNSESANASGGKGLGSFWGMQLQGATVMRAIQDVAKFKE